MQNKDTNAFANSALILGIVSAFLAQLIFVPVLAIIWGSLGMKRATELQNQGVPVTGNGKSLAGLILGIAYLMGGIYLWVR